jgi:hypothetical protein
MNNETFDLIVIILLLISLSLVFISSIKNK